MGKKKVKPFIDRKNASTFHLMHRSQRDVATEVMALLDSNNDGDETLEQHQQIPISQSGMILWPGSDNNLPETNRAMLLNTTKNKNKKNKSSTILEDELLDMDTNDNDSTSKNSNNNNNTNNRTTMMMKIWREQLEGIGIIEEETTRPDRYLKPISGTGTFLDARTGKTVDLQRKKMATNSTGSTSNNNDELNNLIMDCATMEVDTTMFESIPLNTDCMDNDIAAALFDDDNIDNDGNGNDVWDEHGNLKNTDLYEEINDDFIWMAAQEPTYDNDNDNELEQQQSGHVTSTATSTFDYDEHIRQLLEKARKNTTDLISNHNQGHDDANFFSNIQPLKGNKLDDEWDDINTDVDEDECRSNAAPQKLSEAEERVLCEKFEQALAEYDDDEYNDNDEDEDEYDDDHYGDDIDNNDNIGFYDHPDSKRTNHEYNEHLRQQEEIITSSAAADNYNETNDNNNDNDDDIRSHFVSVQGSQLTQQLQRIRRRALEGDPYVEAALDEFLQERDDDVYIQINNSNTNTNTNISKTNEQQQQRTGGSSYSALVDNKLQWGTQWKSSNKTTTNIEQGQEQQQQQQEQVQETIDDILQEANERLAEEPIKPPPLEDVLFNDGKSYFAERLTNPWDCESILTTYSNLDNRPMTIGTHTTSSRRKRFTSRKTTSTIIDNGQQYQPILLSAKTGLPIMNTTNHNGTGTYDNNDANSVLDNMTTTTGGVSDIYNKRSKNETLEEKKQRKFLIKQDRLMSRIQKKVTKEIYSIEYSNKRSVPMEDIAGKTVFRYS